MIHIVNGESAAAALKNVFLETTNQIISLPVDFSVGPITEIHLESCVSTRGDWEASSYHPMNNHSDEALSIYQRSLKKLKDVKNGEQLTIWTCENASEQIGLLIACLLLAGKQVELYTVNTQHAMNTYLKDHEVQQTIRHSGECNGKQLAYFYKHSAILLTEEMKAVFKLYAENVLFSSGLLRSWKHGEILEEEETRYDAFIIDCIKGNSTNNEYVDAIRIIGEVHGLSEQPLSDLWIDYRIRGLIQNGQLAYEGKLQSLKSYRVRIIS